MSPAGWLAWGLVVVGYVGIFFALRFYRWELDDLVADLDDTDKRIDDLAVEVSHVLDHLNDVPSDGRHAADGSSSASSRNVH